MDGSSSTSAPWTRATGLDGIYTAPTDAELRFDLEQQKALGFNTVRKHIEVEPARWFYWADRLGLMVWQDMPAMRTGVTPSTADRTNFESELFRMVDQHRGITSIVQWVPFNEGWGEYDPAWIADLVRGWDPTRLADNNSGSNCCGFDGGNGDVVDDHICVVRALRNRRRPPGWRCWASSAAWGCGSPGHEWSPGNGFAYEMTSSAAALTDRYVQVTGAVGPQRDGQGGCHLHRPQWTRRPELLLLRVRQLLGSLPAARQLPAAQGPERRQRPFGQDATFCAQPGRAAGGVTLVSYNLPDHAIRHVNAEVWIAANGGPDPADNPADNPADVTWAVVPAWTP